MTDIAEQLRNAAYVKFRSGYQSRDLAQKAADEIVRLRLAIATAHADGMEEAARIADTYEPTGDQYDDGQKHSIAAAIRQAKEQAR